MATLLGPEHMVIVLCSQSLPSETGGRLPVPMGLRPLIFLSFFRNGQSLLKFSTWQLLPVAAPCRVFAKSESIPSRWALLV